MLTNQDASLSTNFNIFKHAYDPNNKRKNEIIVEKLGLGLSFRGFTVSLVITIMSRWFKRTGGSIDIIDPNV